jgi:hypothetical protein
MNPRTAEKWIDAHLKLQKIAGIPPIVAQVVEKNYRAAMRKAIPARPRIRLPKASRKVTPQAIKRDLKKELEALCKAIVFTRDCGSPEAREGVCITCGNYRVLQWGHFIAQNHSKWLQYDPRNTAGQCAGCNGPGGRGRPFEYGQAIDKRDGAGSAAALHREAAFHEWWRPNKTTLGQKLAELQKHPLAPAGASPRPEGLGPEGSQLLK